MGRNIQENEIERRRITSIVPAINGKGAVVETEIVPVRCRRLDIKGYKQTLGLTVRADILREGIDIASRYGADFSFESHIGEKINVGQKPDSETELAVTVEARPSPEVVAASATTPSTQKTTLIELTVEKQNPDTPPTPNNYRDEVILSLDLSSVTNPDVIADIYNAPKIVDPVFGIRTPGDIESIRNAPVLLIRELPAPTMQATPRRNGTDVRPINGSGGNPAAQRDIW